MKIKVAIIVLAVAALGLVVALFATKKSAEEQHSTDVVVINDFSNQLVDANVNVKDLRQANLELTNDLAVARTQVLDFSNALASANSTIEDIKLTLVKAEIQITNLNGQVTDLEAQNKALDKRAVELTNTISQLNERIAITLAQLSISKTNTAFLQGELQKQMAQKAVLEHKFSDISEVRAQLGKLKEEVFVARRVQLGKSDISGKKGAELLKLFRSTPATNPPAKNASPYDLNVEVGSDGSVKIIAPAGATNSPAH